MSKVSGKRQDGERAAFRNFVDNIAFFGGGKPENAPEAIALALHAKWNRIGSRYRKQVIMLFTAALPLREEKRVAASNDPEDMPKDLKALHGMFDNGGSEYAPCYWYRGGRLPAFAPVTSGNPWSAVGQWNLAWTLHSDSCLYSEFDSEFCMEDAMEDAVTLVFGDF